MMHQDEWWDKEYAKELARKQHIKQGMQVIAASAILYVIGIVVHYYVGA